VNGLRENGVVMVVQKIKVLKVLLII